MPDSKFISWAHGSSMQLEYPNRVTSVRHTGPFARVEGSPGQNTWVHLPVPTPTVVNGNSVRIGAVLVSFRARANAKVHEIIVYDGDRRVAEHMGLDLQGDHLDARFEVPGAPEAGKGDQRHPGTVLQRQRSGCPLDAGRDHWRRHRVPGLRSSASGADMLSTASLAALAAHWAPGCYSDSHDS